MADLEHLERLLIEARDALLAYWEQPEGQACLLGLRDAMETVHASRAADNRTLQIRDPAAWQRVTTLVEEVTRLAAPLEGAI